MKNDPVNGERLMAGHRHVRELRGEHGGEARRCALELASLGRGDDRVQRDERVERTGLEDVEAPARVEHARDLAHESIRLGQMMKDVAHDDLIEATVLEAVSYTHLTLPTIYSV